MTTRGRSGLIDYDYKHKLNADEKKWLESFTDGYYRGSHRKHTDKFDEKESAALDHAHYARRTDIYSRCKQASRHVFTVDGENEVAPHETLRKLGIKEARSQITEFYLNKLLKLLDKGNYEKIRNTNEIKELLQLHTAEHRDLERLYRRLYR